MPLVAGEFVLHVLTIGAYYVILAVSWNLLAGFTGQFSLAQHAFAAVGAYRSGLMVYHLKTPLWVGIPGRRACWPALAGYLLGRLVLRMRAIYLVDRDLGVRRDLPHLSHRRLRVHPRRSRLERAVALRHVRSDAVLLHLPRRSRVLVLLGLRLLIDSPIGYFMRAVKDDRDARQDRSASTPRRVKIARLRDVERHGRTRRRALRRTTC